MVKKTAFFGRVNQISDALGITQELTHRVLTEYLKQVRSRVLEGHQYTFIGIVDVVPEYQVLDYRETQAFLLQEIAKSVSTTYFTANSIVSAFFDFLWEDLKAGKPVTFNSICTVTPLKEGGRLTKVWVRTSQALSRDMQERGNRVRCRTSPYLKKVFEKNGGDTDDR